MLERISTAAFLKALGGYQPHRQLVAALTLHPGFVRGDELVDYVHGWDEDGGPEWAWASLKVIALTLRRKGVAIHGKKTRGFYLDAAA